MAEEQLPGLRVHINDGRVAGTFDLPPADMEQISYGGRVMFVLVADVSNIKVGDTKEGDTKATWTFTVADSAIVRDDNMKEHLAETLFLNLADQLPLGDALRSFRLSPTHVGDFGHKNDLPEGDLRQANGQVNGHSAVDDFEPLDEALLADQKQALQGLDDLAAADELEDGTEMAELPQVVSAPAGRRDPALSAFLEDHEKQRKSTDVRHRDDHLKSFLEDVTR